MIAKDGKTIVVVGATGLQEREVLRHLVGNGWLVKGLTRDPESKKAVAVRALGAELVRANLDDISTLESAFQGAYGVYTMQPPIPGKPENEIQQGKNVALAFMELMTDSSYYPNVIWYIWPKITGGDRKIPWISMKDVGVIAAKAFADPAEFMGKDFVLSADALSLDECRAIYKEVRGKYPPRFPMPMLLFEKFVGKDIPRMWSWLRTHPVHLDTSQTRKIHPEAMTVRTWLEST